MQAITLRRRTSSVHSMDRILEERTAHANGVAHLTNVMYGGSLFGAQVMLRFRSEPGAGGRPPTSDLSAEVGEREGE